MEVGKEVVDGLREDTGPIDGVDGSKAMSGIEFLVCEKCFDDVLGKIE